MKTVRFLQISLLLAAALSVPSSFAQDYTRWGLPEGAKKRIGKGWISSNIAYSPDGALLAVATSIGIWLYDANTGAEVNLLTGHPRVVNSIAFSPNSFMLASGSPDSTIRLWNAHNGKQARTLEGHDGSVNCVAFSPVGYTIASGSRDSTIRLWNSRTGVSLHTLEGHSDDVVSVAFSPDGFTLASASRDGTIRLWNARTGEALQIIDGRTDTVTSVAFSLDGLTLASGSRDLWTSDDTVRLWDARTGGHLRTLEGHTNSVTSVTFSPDGGTLASGSRDGTILLWELTPDASSAEFSAADVNQDGVVNILDLVLVAAHFGESGKNGGDINADGIVNLLDLEMVAAAFGDAAAAPSTHPQALGMLMAADVQKWLIDATALEVGDPRLKKGIAVLEQLLAELETWAPVPTETALLPNYPNPFNPDTWLPYRLAKESAVAIRIYNHSGTPIRTLSLGVQGQGDYLSLQEAAYWDGRNDAGEPVGSGVYWCTLDAGDYQETRKMAIQK